MFLPSNITLKFGDSGDFVAEMQRRLAAVKAHGEDAINGFYDGVTVNSVTSFQARSGIHADGIAGPETLRKLNGIISGDTSSTSDKKEEDATKQLNTDQVAREMYMLDHTMPAVAPTGFGTREAEVQPETRQAELQPSAYAAPSAPSPESQQQLQREQMMQREPAPQPHAGETLAQMLLQQPGPAPQHAAHQPAHASEAKPAQAPTLRAESHPAQAATQSPSPTTPQAQPAELGIVGRAMQKVDAFVQRMAEYFEAKLPPHVLREVKHLGQVMLQSGVKEATIPSGPEQVRAPSLPARGPEQQPQQLPQRH